MLNKDKYKTAQEARKVFYHYCINMSCRECPYYCENSSENSCSFLWLYAEAEADKNPTPQWQKNLMEKFTSKE